MTPLDRLRHLGGLHADLTKGKAHPVGHRSKRKDGWYVKQLDGSWDKEHAAAPQRAAPPPPEPPERGAWTGTPTTDQLIDFARAVRTAAKRAPIEASPRHDPQDVLISHVWKQMQRDGTTNGLDEATFKQWLVEGDKQNRIWLSPAAHRLDDGLDGDGLRASAVPAPGRRSLYLHFVRVLDRQPIPNPDPHPPVETKTKARRKRKAPTPDLHTQREDALVDWEQERTTEAEARLTALGLHPVVPRGTTTRMDARLHVVPKDAPREHAAFPGDEVEVVHGGWRTDVLTYRRAEVRAVPRPPPEPARPSDAILGVLGKRRSLRLADLRRALPDVPKHALNAALLSLHRSGRTTYHAVSLV